MTFRSSPRAGRAPRLALPLALALLVLVPATAGAVPIQQLSLPNGCLRQASAGGCANAGTFTGTASNQVYMVTDPNGGSSLYVTNGADGIAIFDVNQTTGVVTRRPGTAGCIAESGDNSTCAKAKGLSGVRALAISRDGTRLFAASNVTGGFNGIAIFTRNPSTGQLGQDAAGGNACVADATSASNPDGCTVLVGLPTPADLGVSKDGKHIYVASHQVSNNDIGWLADIEYNGTTPSQANNPACFTTPANGSPGSCAATARGLVGPLQLKVAPDGNNLYISNWGAGGDNDMALVNYAIDQTSGQLTQPNASAGCLMPATNSASCGIAPTIAAETAGIAFLDDGHVYVSTRKGSTITLFNRATGAGFGALTPATGTGACVTSDPAKTQCAAARRLYATQRLMVSPDHKTLLSVGIYSSGITAYDINDNATLTPVAGGNGCYTPSANSSDGCTQYLGGESLPFDVVITPNNRYAVVSAWGSDSAPSTAAGLMVFAMDPNPPACQDKTASTTANTVVKVQLACTDADGDAMTLQASGAPSSGVVGAFDSAAQTVEYAPGSGFTGTATFKYVASDGQRTSAPATVTVTVTAAPGPSPTPTPTPTPTPVTPRVTNQLTSHWAWSGNTTMLTGLKVNGTLPAGAKVVLRCAGKKCPFKTVKVPVKKGKANPYKALKPKQRKFHTKQKMTVLITAPGRIGRAVVYTFVRNKQPKSQVLCTPVGSTKLKKTC